MIGGVIFGALVALPLGLLGDRLLNRGEAPEPALAKPAAKREQTGNKRRD